MGPCVSCVSCYALLMKSVQSEEVRRNFRAHLNEVEHDGEHIEILRYQIPAAVMVPPKWHRRAEALMAKYGETEG